MRKFRGIVAWLIVILSFGAALYVGAWVLFIQPIITCCQAFDANTLTGTMIGWAVVKCVFAGPVAGLIWWAGSSLGLLIECYE